MNQNLKKICLMLVCLAVCMLGGPALAQDDGLSLDVDAMFDGMMAEFEEIAKIPHGSGNTDAISDYLYAWGQNHGFASMQDEVGNVRWDVPATAGYEDAPLTILQAHMDMVVVSDDGRVCARPAARDRHHQRGGRKPLRRGQHGSRLGHGRGIPDQHRFRGLRDLHGGGLRLCGV